MKRNGFISVRTVIIVIGVLLIILAVAAALPSSERWIMLMFLLQSTIISSAPIGYSALGGVFSERSGVVNIALEGILLVSAIGFVAGADVTGSVWGGIFFGVLAGMLLALVHAIATVTFKINHIVSGVALNIAAVGLTRMLCFQLFGQETQSATNSYTYINLFGRQLDIQWVVSLMLFVVFAPLAYYILFHTSFGLRLRSVGENPKAADSLGINVEAMRYAGVLLSGFITSFGGIALYPSVWQSGISGGRGFIGLASMILGNWMPIRAVLSSTIFGFADALRTFEFIRQLVPDEFLTALPYLLVMIVLAGLVGKATPPRADGIPYIRGEE